MAAADWLIAAGGIVMQEIALFAAVGFLIVGSSDLAIDLIWIVRAAARKLGPHRAPELADAAREPGRLAIFVPAWDESAVIAEMLGHALATLRYADYRLYVGCYPNDPATVEAVRGVGDPRVRLVVGSDPGPTTKADCLNRLWEAMLADEAREGRRARAVVLHDAEDVVHPAELGIFDALIGDHDLVQLPVLPLIDENSRWIAGHYADEFAESHGKEMVVREALGAAVPSAGVGCAFSRDALDRIAGRQSGEPFDADSLTEDYELGLKLRALGGKTAFVRVTGGQGSIVMTREYFPSTIRAAVNQKARWMTGIALSGWDRLGWSGGLAERWMRLRDRRSVLAALLLFAGYLALLLWAALSAAHIFLGLAPPPIGKGLGLLLTLNAFLLAWRLVMRFGFVTAAYGWREGLRSVPRVVTANAIAMLAARKAVTRYLARSGRPRWDKTAHAFPVSIAVP